ncbi:MAG: phosphomannomutase/phosphoglucomutase [Burkholderiales bacterium]|nr:MAG: phosphomannomutase/phosphoglucomutase [Burkholderiales bacterium]
MVAVEISPSIFKAYDIRGIVDRTLTAEAVTHIGRAFGLAGTARGVDTIVVGRDGRLSGPAFVEALAGGINDAGLDVIDIGQVATPMVYFAGFHLNTGSGVMVTGSHNPPDYNGLKMVLAGETLYGPTIQALRETIESGATAALPAARRGATRSVDIDQAYLQRIIGDIRLARPMKIAIDCGNGSPGRIAPKLYRALGCEVTALFCDVDGTFPNHHPDPAHVENLQDLMRTLAQTDCEIGLAFDGDGDRLGVVTKQGHIIWPDRQLMLFARDVLGSRPGEQVIFDVKCSRHVGNVVRAAGGEPLMWRTGHSLIKAKLKETGAPLAGEMSGHVFFNDRWYGFDDGLYAGARLLEILSRSDDPSAVLDALPDSPTTPELHLHLDEGENFAMVEALQKNAKFEGASQVITIDGVRAEYPDGFGLARASNTTPVLVMRFEADTPEALARIQAAFRDAVLAIKPDAKMPF